MKEYPVGSVCVCIGTPSYPELKDVEVTIIEPLELRTTTNYRTGVTEDRLEYRTDLILPGTTQGCYIRHQFLRLKQLPPSSEFDSFMSKLKEPLPLGELLKIKFGGKEE